MNPSLIERARARRLNALRYIEQKAEAGIARPDRGIRDVFIVHDRPPCVGHISAFHSYRRNASPLH
jgi:hypothetical protein